MCRLAVHGNTEHYMKNITKNIVQVEDIPWELHPTPSRDRMWKTNFWPCGKTNKYRCWAGYNCMKPASKACIWFFTLVLTSLSQLSRVSFPIFSMELKSASLVLCNASQMTWNLWFYVRNVKRLSVSGVKLKMSTFFFTNMLDLIRCVLGLFLTLQYVKAKFCAMIGVFAIQCRLEIMNSFETLK